MDKLTAIKIKYDDGTYSDEIPISALSENVEWDSTHTLVDILGNIDVDVTGTIQDQISQLSNSKVNTTDLNNYVNSTMKTEVAGWLNNYISPATGTIAYDASLSIQGAAADAKAAGQIVQISTTKPTKENNRIWVGAAEEEYEVPTMDEFNDLNANLSYVSDDIGITKNLFRLNAVSNVNQGITFTVDNIKGTITANGTSTGRIYRPFGSVYLTAGNYILSGAPHYSYPIQLLNADNTAIIAQQQHDEKAFTIATDGIYNLRLYYGTNAVGAVIDNMVYTPMIRSAQIVNADFEPCGLHNSTLFIGDSYVQANSLGNDKTKRFSTLICENFKWRELNYAVGGMGFLEGATPYLTQVETAAADDSFDNADVKHVFIFGGINDLNFANMVSLLPAAVNAVINACKTYFPNAEIITVPFTYYDVNISQQGFYIYKTISAVSKTAKCKCIPHAYTWLTGMKSMILSDNVHPTVEGHALIASHIINALTIGNSEPYPASCSLSAVATAIDATADLYCALLLTNTELSVNAIFTLTTTVSANTRLFQYENSGTKNNPTFIGKYGKHIPCFNLTTGETAVLLVSQEDTETGYRNYINAFTSMAAGRWKILTAKLNFGVQEYSGNLT